MRLLLTSAADLAFERRPNAIIRAPSLGETSVRASIRRPRDLSRWAGTIRLQNDGAVHRRARHDRKINT